MKHNYFSMTGLFTPIEEGAQKQVWSSGDISLDSIRSGDLAEYCSLVPMATVQDLREMIAEE